MSVYVHIESQELQLSMSADTDEFLGTVTNEETILIKNGLEYAIDKIVEIIRKQRSVG